MQAVNHVSVHFGYPCSVWEKEIWQLHRFESPINMHFNEFYRALDWIRSLRIIFFTYVSPLSGSSHSISIVYVFLAIRIWDSCVEIMTGAFAIVLWLGTETYKYIFLIFRYQWQMVKQIQGKRNALENLSHRIFAERFLGFFYIKLNILEQIQTMFLTYKTGKPSTMWLQLYCSCRESFTNLLGRDGLQCSTVCSSVRGWTKSSWYSLMGHYTVGYCSKESLDDVRCHLSIPCPWCVTRP